MKLPEVEVSPPGIIGRFFIWLAGADLATLKICPQRDHGIVMQDGALLIAICVYQAVIYSAVLEKTLSPSGQFRPELIALGIGLAFMVLLIDVVMVMTTSWVSAGEEALRRGGLALEINWPKRIQTWFFLAIRISITLISSQLTGMLTGILIFSADIESIVQHDYLAANASIIVSATSFVDGEIVRISAALKSETDHASSTSTQIDRIRGIAVDPTTADPNTRQILGEISQLEAEKVKASTARVQAQDFASNELAGLKNAPGNSGLQGNGPVRAAALEKVRHAADDEKRIDDELASARQRLDAIQKQSTSTSETARHRATGQLPEFQNALATEQDKIRDLQNQLARLTADRDEAIQRIVANDPNFHARDEGLVAQLKALRRVTEGDPTALMLVLLIDAFAFLLEAAVVCAKAFARVPTTYAALVARNCILSDVAIAEEVLEDLAVRNARTDLDHPFAIGKPKEPGSASDTPEQPAGSGEMPVRRKRGRPRKNPPSTDPTGE